ncbi:MAG: two-component system, cell cycle sensor histidine kinase and response regulator CckA [Gaiellaceae bacterium]|nr:two-component system, cell cycle sensor histidine kinase and response regulator CckA [Gaiellaceae bacterium]MDX6509048.1 two-component system, cell cycle sensor histidine kinase and response regulator CckA [Gaiellaceae bacterium]
MRSRVEARAYLAVLPLVLATVLIVASEILPAHLRDPLGARAALMLFAIAMAGLVARSQVRTARSELGLRARRQERTDVELVHAEERLELAQGIARIGAWDVDLITGTTVWSHSMGQILGVGDAPPDNALFLSLIHADDRERMDRELAESLERGGDYELDFRIVRPNGGVRWLLSRGRIIADETGQAVRKIGAAVDISERHEADDERVKLEQQLRHAQKLHAIGRLAGGVAHDFNNVLLAIRGYGELALRAIDRGADATQEVEEMLAGAERAAALTRQLLAFSRRQVLRSDTIDLRDTVRDMDKMLRPLIGEDVELVTELCDEPVLVHGDPGQLEQVLANLAVNARDAMPGGGRLMIRVGVADVDATQASDGVAERSGMLSVTDTGSGMDSETVEQMFDPFFTTKDAGTGLGLATVHGIVTQSGGSIWVHTEPGQGTTFKIYLPLAHGTATQKPLLPHVSAPPAGGLGETILLVEDDPQVRAVVGKMLESLDYRVLPAGDGEDALALAEAFNGPIDLLVSDLVMPGLGGRQVAERLRESSPDTAVLYMSGYSDEAVVRRGVVDSDASFLKKPFATIDLARRVREMLDERAAA